MKLPVNLPGAGQLLPREKLAEILQKAKGSGQKVVFTNGVFDLLHLGHVELLAQARQQGDLLVVGLNSDSSTRQLKGPTRPVHDQIFRAGMLLSLRWVDFVTIFDETEASATIQVLRPDVYVKGGDYTVASLPETPVVEAAGGVVKILPLTPGQGSSDIIKNIRALPEERAEDRQASVFTNK